MGAMFPPERPVDPPTPGPPAGPPPGRSSRRGWLLAAGAGLVVAVAAAVVLIAVDPFAGPEQHGTPAATPVVAGSSDLNRARQCVDAVRDPKDKATAIRGIRLKHVDSYGTVLMVDVTVLDWVCIFATDGSYLGASGIGVKHFPEAYLPRTDPGAPILRKGTGVRPQRTGDVLEFDDVGRISADVRAVRIACPGAPPAPATIVGSVYYGRIRIPDDPKKKEEDSCAAEALDADGRVIGRAHW